MSEKYKVRDQDKLYFITFAVVQWVDIFTRPLYRDTIIESLKFCQQEKGLEVYAWCLMSNHIHLIVGRNGNTKLEDIIRDFKKYTSVHICKQIENNEQESRRRWILWIFRETARKSNKHQKYCFWQQEYHPIELSTNAMMEQKLDYIHHNPVEAGIVENPEDYLYSSARNYAGMRGLIDITFIE